MSFAHHVSRPSPTLFATTNPTLDRRPFAGAAFRLSKVQRVSLAVAIAAARNPNSRINKNGGAVSG